MNDIFAFSINIPNKKDPGRSFDVGTRPFLDSDAAALSQIASDPALISSLSPYFPSPFTLEHAKEFIHKTNEEQGSQKIIVRAVTVDGELAGVVSLKKIRRYSGIKDHYSLGYYLDEGLWNQGIMGALVPLFCDRAFQLLDIERMSAEVRIDTIASMKVLERAGFVFEGLSRAALIKDGIYYDVVRFSRSVLPPGVDYVKAEDVASFSSFLLQNNCDSGTYKSEGDRP